MTSKRRLFFVTALMAGIFFLVGFLVSFQLPKVRSWLLVQINDLSDKELPVRLLPTDLQLDLFPLGATFRGVRIIPKGELKGILEPMLVEQVSITVSTWQLIQGRLRLHEIYLKGTEATVEIPKPKGSDGPPLDGLFALIKKLPISRLRLDDVDLKLTVLQPRINADLRRVHALIESMDRGLSIELAMGSSSVLDHESNARVRVEAAMTGFAQPKGVTISEFKLRRGDSYIVASGSLRGDTEALKFSEIRLDTRTSLHLESMRNWVVKSFPKFEKFPVILGRAEAEIRIRGTKDSEPMADFQLSTSGLTFDNFFADQIKTAGRYELGIVTLPDLEFKNPGGHALLKNTELRIPKSRQTSTNQRGPPTPFRVKTDFTLAKLDIKEFLKTLKQKNVNVYGTLSGHTPCEGTISPQLRLNCHGSVHGEKIVVNETPDYKGSVIALPVFDAKGEYTIDNRGVTFKADLSMPSSVGRGGGTLEYDNGFKFYYEADRLDFRDAANLADLKLEGIAKIKGTTEGNSKAATLTLQADGTEMWFENYWLGNPRAIVSYKAGILGFGNMTAQYPSTRFEGNLEVNLPKKTIAAQGNFPAIDIKDLLKIFSRRVQIPIAVAGAGKATIKVWGPLQFNKLSYDLKSTLNNGVVMRENFDQAYFDVHSRDGEVVADRVMMARENSTISVTGVGHPSGDINTVVRGRGIKLEDSVNVKRLGLNLSGIVDFDMDMNGHVLHPNTDLRGTIVKTAVGDQGVPDSSFRLSFAESSISGGGNFLGNLVQADFIVPLNAAAPFKLNLKTQDWNYAPIFAALAGRGARKDFDGRLTSTLRLESPSGGFWNASGSMLIQKFVLRRGALQMVAPEPLAISMENGSIQVQNLFLEGDGTFLRVVNSPNAVAKSDLQVNGKLDLSLMSLLTPFFEELRGLLSFAFNLRAGPENTAVLGSVYVDKGFLKLFDFPHPFEDIRADFLFSQKKVLVNSLKTELGGGRISADGMLELRGYKNYPLQISALVEKVNLNVPENMRTSGSGRLYITGSWFPFTMRGIYDVADGMITSEFDSSGTPISGVQRSSFLPKTILQENFSPLDLDLVVNMPNEIGIKNSKIEGDLTGRLTVKGPPNHSSILGSINVTKGSKIFFRDNVFDLQAGVVTFDDPSQINPGLYVTAASRVGDYDVNLILQGTSNRPELSLTSSPPLSEPDIISLLALGVPGQQLDSVSARDNVSASGISIGGSIIKDNPAADQIKKTTGFEVGVGSSYDSDSNVAVPKITAARKITPNFGVTASRSIGNNPKTEAKLRYQLSNRFSVAGSWEGQELQENQTSTGTGTTEQTQDTLGIDFEYRFEFK